MKSLRADLASILVRVRVRVMVVDCAYLLVVVMVTGLFWFPLLFVCLWFTNEYSPRVTGIPNVGAA